MKKISKLLACGCLAGAMVAGGFALSSCSSWTTTVSQGEYKYENPWSAGSYYGVKVSVEVQTDENGDRIRSVTIEDSDYTQASEGWEGRDNYLENEQTLLNAYRGKYVADVLAMKVTTDYQGQPSEVSDDSVLITDATQSSGRLLLAVQDALCNFGYSVFEGEYHYPNAWDDTAPDYGIRVRVVMKGNVVRKVAVISSGYTEVSSGWDGKDTWTNNLEGLLSSYVGKTKTQILDQTVTVSSGGQPDSVSDDSYVITGATQGSGRLLLAVQNALDPSGAQTTKVYTGEYHYANAWDSSAPDYGIRVAVKVKGGYILSVEVLDSDYVEVSEGWENANLWNDGLSNLLSKYAGKTVQEVLAVEVTTSESTPGQPEDISDQQYVIAGATQGSGRLMLAVQNALSMLASESGDNGGSEEPENPYVGWDYNEYIDAATTYEVNSDGSVTYNIVTTSYGYAEAFTIEITVANGEISQYSILTNGSTGGFESSMSAIANNMVGQTLEQLQDYLEGDEIQTGATYSNTLCVNAGLFALANFEAAGGSSGGEQPDPDPDPDPDEPEDTNTTTGPFVSWSYNQYISSQTTVRSDYFGNAIYNIVTTSNGHAQPFEINIVVNDQKVIVVYEIVTNGSTSDHFAGIMSSVAKNMVGKNQADLEEILQLNNSSADDQINTGATLSNVLCINAGLFAVSNYDIASADEFIGEYKYENAWVPGSYYGIRVSVRVKDGVIVAVNEVASDYTSVTDSWANKDIWVNNIESLLKAYQGKTVEEILDASVTVDASGQPSAVSDAELMISGATQGSGRLLLAVQNALSVIEDNYARTFVGEYHYANPWAPTAPDYGIRVAVTVKGEDIVNVEVLESDYTEVSDGWNNANLWNDGLEGLLTAYESKTVEEVLAAYVTAQADGQPNVVSDADLMITGATQGSGRLLLAVQNALDPTGANTTKVYTGEYKYENTWVPGSYYGIKVAVTVKGETILKVEVLDSDYTEVTDSWEDKDIWINNLDSLLAAYEGKTVAEIFDVDVTVDGNGQPTAVSDSELMISGATQGSGRLMLAVQNALSLLNPNPDEPEEPEEPENPYADWQYNEYIDAATTYTANSDGSVTYNIVTTANAPANAFEITITVADGAITEYDITVNGSTSDHFAEIMSSVAKNMVGQTLEQLEAYLEGDEIQSGATRSNELCVNAGLFALANVDKATAAE